jgi:hypothetical protein
MTSRGMVVMTSVKLDRPPLAAGPLCRYSPPLALCAGTTAQLPPTMYHSALISVSITVSSFSGSPGGLSLDIRLGHSKAIRVTISPRTPRHAQPP